MPESETVNLVGQEGRPHVFSTVAPERGNVLTINLKPCFVSMGLPDTSFKPEFRWSGESKIFDAAVGGGASYPGIVWIFMGENYVRYNLETHELVGPQRTYQNWARGQWPYRTGFDAAVTFTSQPQYMWFFRGNTYFRYDLVQDRMAGGPVPIVGNWPGWPQSFAGGIDAAIEGRGNYEGMAWFFKGSEYLRYNDNAGVKRVDSGPTPIASKWRGWPESFDRVDCAISGIGSETELIYFFRGDQFIVYDLNLDKVVGPPRPIDLKWPKLSPFIRRPQLFMVETLKMDTYYGDVSAGPPQGGTTGLGPNEEQTYTVIISRRTTDTLAETTTVLDSQDQTLVDNINTAMHDSSTTLDASERYDYNFSSSFEGELSYSGLGGDVEASLDFQGSSNDVRKEATTAASEAVQQQVSRTEENRRQSTRVVSGTHVSETITESSFVKSVRNPTSHPITIGVYQLYQEYLSFTTLSDVQVAFANGGQIDKVPLSRLDLLLSRYVVDDTAAKAIKAAVTKELKQVLDYRRRPVDVVGELPDGRIEFNSEITSEYARTNLDGSVRQNYVISGVILATDKFKQLTQAALLQEITVG